MAGLRGDEERGWGGFTPSHRDAACSDNPGRDAGRVAHGGTSTRQRGQWVEGSPGAKVMYTVQFSAPPLYSLRSPNSGLEILYEKQLPQC